MAITNVLILAAAEQSPQELSIQAQLVSRLNSLPRFDSLVVTLPRAEAMLVPRLVGMWGGLVFIGAAGSPPRPTHQTVLERQAELFDVLPTVAIVARPGQLWGDWTEFHSRLAQSQPDSHRIDPDVTDAVDRVLHALRPDLRAAIERS